MRTLSAQLRETSFSGELDLGSAADFAKAYSFRNSGGYVTVLFASASASLPCTVSGATAAVDIFGNAVGVTGGKLTLTDMPMYIRSTTPIKILDIGNGLISATNIATAATASVAPGMSPTNVSRINDGALNSSYIYSQAFNPAYSPYIDTNDIMPGTAALTWGSAQRIKRIGLIFDRPWQGGTAPVAFNVQALVSGAWKTIHTYRNATATSMPFANPGMGTTYDTYYNGEWIVHYLLPSPVTATAIRVNLTQSTWGNCPDSDTANLTAAPYTGNGCKQRLTLNDFRAYSN